MASFTWPPEGSGSGGGGILSINADTTAAQLIAGASGVSASTAMGTTTISLVAPFSTQSFSMAAGRYVNFGNNVNVSNVSTFSWAGWFKPSGLSGLQTLIKKIDSNPTGYDFYLDDDTLAAHLLQTLVTSDLRWHTPAGTFSKVGVWYHIVIAKTIASNVAGFTVYVNGVSQTLTTDSNTLSGTITNTGNLYFGFATNQTSPFVGEMNNFLYYNRVLTPTEVTALYNNGTPVDPTTLSSASALVHSWPLGNGDDAVAAGGFTDRAGSVTGTGVGTTVGSIIPDAPGNSFGGMSAVNPVFSGPMIGDSVQAGALQAGANGVTFSTTPGTTYTTVTVNSKTWGTIDGRYTPTLLQQNFDLWDYSGNSRYIGASAGLSQMSPFKALAGDMLILGYSGGDAIPTYVLGKIKAKAGTPLLIEADQIVTGGVAASNYEFDTPATGDTVSIGAGVSVVVLDPAGTLATLTVVLPANPIDKQRCRVGSSQIVTTLTVSPAAAETVKNAPSAFAAGGSFEYIYRSANTTWYRIG